jgi:two-component system response regulator YesN
MWKILLVDDDAVVRKGIRLSIDWRAQGFEVVAEAANGKRALELVGECHPDILLTDIRMPVCDGLWLCEQVAERYPEVRMVIFSGYEDFDYARRAIRVGVQEYIVKPVDAAFLLESLRKIAGSLARAEEARRFRARSEGVAWGILGGRDITNAIVLHSVKYVEGNYMNDVDVCAVAGEMGISENYFSRIFKAETGINFIEFLNRYRVERAKALLSQPDLKVNDVAEMVGYQTYKSFHHNFTRYAGQAPARFKEHRHE